MWPESEICCGAAGSYNLTQPEMAEALGERKVANIRATGAQAVLMGNVGCLLQVARHLKRVAPDVWVAHTIDALWASFERDASMLEHVNSANVATAMQVLNAVPAVSAAAPGFATIADLLTPPRKRAGRSACAFTCPVSMRSAAWSRPTWESA